MLSLPLPFFLSHSSVFLTHAPIGIVSTHTREEEERKKREESIRGSEEVAGTREGMREKETVAGLCRKGLRTEMRERERLRD